MRLEDMPPKLRAAALAAIAHDTLGPIAPKVTSAPTRRRAGRAQMRWACRACGEIFTHYKPAERHVDTEHGAGRIEVEL